MNKQKQSEYKKQQYYERKAQHVCVRCGKSDERTKEGGTYCRICLDYQALADIEYQKKPAYRINCRRRKHIEYYERKAAGLCVSCGKESRPGKIRCQKCRDRIKKCKNKKKEKK